MKTESMSISEFMNRKKKPKKKRTALSLLPLATAPAWAASPVAAAESVPVNAVPVVSTADVYGKMVNAFDPLVALIQSLAYPIAMVVVLGGALFVMIGNKEKGFTMMQSAGLGYVLVQITPMVLDILAGAMKVV